MNALAQNISALPANLLNVSANIAAHDLRNILMVSPRNINRFRRDSYDHHDNDEYEVVCKHSNTGISKNKPHKVLLTDSINIIQ